MDRTTPGRKQVLDLPRIREEVEALLESVDDQGVCRLPMFEAVPDAEKKLQDIALSGDGEPTMVPEFADVCALLHEIQLHRSDLEFKLVLITNGTLLDRSKVQAGIEALLSRNGEVWAKLDAGTEAWYQQVNMSRVSLDHVESNLVGLGRNWPFKIQSFFCTMEGKGWDEEEIAAYLNRLARLRASGARILEVQLYTLARRPADSRIAGVKLSFLEEMLGRIANLKIPARVYASAE